jgi:hypothetical protein
MLINGKSFAEIDGNDLGVLIEDQVPEGKHFEYKIALPGNSDRDKKEFLADVSSFSNSAGGYIFFGIAEENGLPTEIEGFKDIDSDAQILRLENMLRDSIAPRLPGINIRSLPLQNNSTIIVINIPASWASPHMVTFGGISKFYSRNSAGKYQLDVFELRTAFNATNIRGESLKNFRTERASKIIATETPVTLKEGPKVILHLIPMNVFNIGSQYDLREFQIHPNRDLLAPIDSAGGNNFRFNFDGVLTFDQPNRMEPAVSYLQLFRNGIIESACTSLFDPDRDPPLIPSILFEEELVRCLGRYFSIQNVLEIDPPYFVLLTLLNISGYFLPANNRMFMHHINLIDTNDIFVPEILVEDVAIPTETILKPALDAVWNAAGQPQSPFYDDDGNWNPR